MTGLYFSLPRKDGFEPLYFPKFRLKICPPIRMHIAPGLESGSFLTSPTVPRNHYCCMGATSHKAMHDNWMAVMFVRHQICQHKEAFIQMECIISIASTKLVSKITPCAISEQMFLPCGCTWPWSLFIVFDDTLVTTYPQTLLMGPHFSEMVSAYELASSLASDHGKQIVGSSRNGIASVCFLFAFIIALMQAQV